MSLRPEIKDRIEKLQEKFEAMGQDLESYLDGLLYSNYLKYWDYINLDALLNLQQPKTNFPDEHVFILYHQITELHFKLILHALEEIAEKEELQKDFFLQRLKRINTYFEVLVHSFDIMIEGMEKEQFKKFRMALLPASGFQSAQYREVEICSTDLINLVDTEERDNVSSDDPVEDLYPKLYWKRGATELATGNKTLTLKQFEKKYGADFVRLARDYQSKNLWQCYQNLPKKVRQDETLQETLRQLDFHANINWPLVHYKAAVRYLYKKPKELAATGGTNWQEYLPPRNQRIIFFPDLWSDEEKETWGENLVDKYTYLGE